MLYQLKYYRDFFAPPPPIPTPITYIPPTLPSHNHDYVTAGFFVGKLIREWDLWTPFEEALLDLPSQTNRSKEKSSIRDLIVLRQNVQTFAYAIAVVMPWRKHPQTPVTRPAKTFAGAILTAMGNRFLRPWDLVDSMFDEDDRTYKALEMVLQVDSLEKANIFREIYGQFWAGHVLCAAIFKWCEISMGEVGEEKLQEIWDGNKEYWKSISEAVDRVRWNTWDEGDTGTKDTTGQ
jgi:hypothetical protein